MSNSGLPMTRFLSSVPDSLFSADGRKFNIAEWSSTVSVGDTIRATVEVLVEEPRCEECGKRATSMLRDVSQVGDLDGWLELEPGMVHFFCQAHVPNQQKKNLVDRDT